MSLFMTSAVEELNTEDSIKFLRRGLDRVAEERSLLKMAHDADLTWVVGELKGVLASWGDTEILNAVTKDRVQHLVAALDEKIKEES